MNFFNKKLIVKHGKFTFKYLNLYICHFIMFDQHGQHIQQDDAGNSDVKISVWHQIMHFSSETCVVVKIENFSLHCFYFLHKIKFKNNNPN